MGEVWKILLTLDLRMMLVPVLVAFVAQPLRPKRWQEIFPPDSRPGFFLCYGALSIGNMANNFLPGRGGDLLRCFLLRRKHPEIGVTVTLATLGLEKIFDSMVLLLVVLLSLFLLNPPGWLVTMALLGSCVLVFAFASLFLLHYRTEWFQSLANAFFLTLRLKGVAKKSNYFLERFAQGLHILSSPLQTLKVVVMTVLVWTGEAAVIWSLAVALGVPLTIVQAVTVLAVINIGLSIPAAPGFIGTYEFFSVGALRLFDIDMESALALTLLMHAWGFLVTTIRGLLWLLISGVVFSQLFNKQENVDASFEDSRP